DQQVLLVEPRGGGYTFRHSLLREAVEEQLLPAERTALHRACARALTADRSLAYGSPAAELAWHWYAAGDHGRALPASVEAAVAAQSSFGFAEACGHLERALQLWESGAAADVPGAPPVDGLQLRLLAAECANLAGNHERAASLARAAAGSLGPATAPGSAALVWERLGRYLWDAGASEDALVAYERAVELVGDDRETQVAARVLGAQATGLARFHGAALQAMIINTLFRLGRWDEGDRRAREAFDANPAGMAAMDLHLARAKISMARGDFATTAADLEAVKALSARAIDPRFVVPV